MNHVNVSRDEWLVDPSSLPEINALDKDFLPLEVFEAIRVIKNGKSPGLDGIGGSLLKYLGDRLCSSLAHLFNHLYQAGVYPSARRKALVCPSKNQAHAYPLTLTEE